MLLYKYFNAGLGERVLRSNKLRFTPPSEFNDLFEFRPRYQNFNEASVLKESMTKEHLQKEIDAQTDKIFDGAPTIRAVYEKANEGFDASSFGLDFVKQIFDVLSDKVPDIFYEQLNKAGVLCLTELPNQPVMWGSYGDNHHGIVLGFDSENEFFDRRKSEKDDLRHLVKVDYYAEAPVIQILEDGEMPKVVSQKPDAWSHEREWRIIQALQDADEIVEAEPPIHLFEFPPSCLREVILGHRVSKETENMVHEVLSDPAFAHVQIKRIEPDLNTNSLSVVNE
ncbi:MAG TPA: DUF2971 domain-containing protein [Pyrinomonadaceae bacterium]|nr:DUF2971 domain-containing protein [Pyrinomonadaceae bacterium]